MTRVKTLALFSGGLDSILAVELILKQGIDVVAVHFVGDDYLRVIREPKHGYGKNMNPCVDCRIFILKKAKKYAEEIGADFIFTGEVLDERPMSQHFAALKMVEEESGLKGKLLRPLSARLLPKTVMEKKV